MGRMAITATAPITAATGSTTADSCPNHQALPRLTPSRRKGMLTDKPSGKFWMPIPMAKATAPAVVAPSNPKAAPPNNTPPETNKPQQQDVGDAGSVAGAINVRAQAVKARIDLKLSGRDLPKRLPPVSTKRKTRILNPDWRVKRTVGGFGEASAVSKPQEELAAAFQRSRTELAGQLTGIMDLIKQNGNNRNDNNEMDTSAVEATASKVDEPIETSALEAEHGMVMVDVATLEGEVHVNEFDEYSMGYEGSLSRGRDRTWAWAHTWSSCGLPIV